MQITATSIKLHDKILIVKSEDEFTECTEWNVAYIRLIYSINIWIKNSCLDWGIRIWMFSCM